MPFNLLRRQRHVHCREVNLALGITFAFVMWLLIGMLNLAAKGPGDEGLLPRQFLPLIHVAGPQIRISGVYYDGYTTGEADEAIQLWNVGTQTVSLAGWKLGDGSRITTLPAIVLPAGTFAWCAREAKAFRFIFGHAPDCEWGADTDPSVPNAQGNILRLSNQGARVTLYTPEGNLADLVSYVSESMGPGWEGPPVKPYTAGGFGTEGQILYRKLDGRAQPLPDTDRATDWAADLADPVAGRRVRYPGWDLEAFWPTYVVTETAHLTVTIAPDNMFETILAHIQAARESIALEGYVLESVPIGLALAERAQAGVAVRVLLEGAPSGGIRDVQRWLTQHIVAAGGQVYYMVNDRNGARNRYRFQHAKLMVCDGRVVYISSENFSPESMPDDDKHNGTWGRRGVGLLTDAPGVVARAQALMAADMDPVHHADIFAWDAADPVYGPPPDGYTPPISQDGTLYQVLFTTPLTLYGTFPFEVVQSPETSLRADAGLLPMVARADAGDTVLVEQLYEHPHWGPLNSNPTDHPNPRLEAYLAAARRGARVRVLLDYYFDDPSDPRSNAATVAYLNGLARQEGLALEARRGNPTYLGLHNKMVLVEADGHGWVHVGSLNGSEIAAKVNRELALQVQSDEVYQYLAEMFWKDWEKSRP
jgi:cardiolipin synthase